MYVWGVRGGRGGVRRRVGRCELGGHMGVGGTLGYVWMVCMVLRGECDFFSKKLETGCVHEKLERVEKTEN